MSGRSTALTCSHDGLDSRRVAAHVLLVITVSFAGALALLSVCSTGDADFILSAGIHRAVRFSALRGSRKDHSSDTQRSTGFLSLTSERGVELLRRHSYQRQARQRATHHATESNFAELGKPLTGRALEDSHLKYARKLVDDSVSARSDKALARVAVSETVSRKQAEQKTHNVNSADWRNSSGARVLRPTVRTHEFAVNDVLSRNQSSVDGVLSANAQNGASAVSSGDHPQSRLFQHFDADGDGQLSEREVANLLKQLTRKRREDASPASSLGSPSASEARAAGVHDISIDGETLNVGESDFDLLFKQLSNLKQTKDPSKDPRMTLQEDIVFVKDLVIVFFAATIGGVLARQFQQPALIGFLIGGMIVGPGGLGAVTELVEVETLASVGIAFLLFSLGIEFSVPELQSVRRVVLLGGLLSMFAIVVVTGVLSLIFTLVKTVPEAIALGLAVSLSSTAVVLQCLPGSHENHDACRGPEEAMTSSTARANAVIYDAHTDGSSSGKYSSAGDLRETEKAKTGSNAGSSTYRADVRNLSDDNSAVTSATFDSPRSRKVMLGLLVFQDVMIGLILALLPTLQGSLGQFLEETVSAVLRLGCFVMLCLILGEFVLPMLSDCVEKAKSQEVFTMGCVVFCLAMAYLSERMGLAIELGAFAAGIMLSESRHKRRAEDSVEGIRTVFTAVFFISVGMVIHWRYFYQNFFRMLILLGIILICKAVVFSVVFFSFGGLPIRTALACGATIAQAGEFTFVVASKGQALTLFSAAEARMINGATALSMLATPVIVRYASKWSQRSSGKGAAGCSHSSLGDAL